jgi:dsDNA-binding SOS-regulon protein
VCGMEIDYNKLWDLVTLVRDNCKSFRLDEKEQRELLAWFKAKKPELLREICCEDCPEHMEYENYCENKAERGK